MAITAAGVGSGLDIENIISQLMLVEQQPLVVMQQKEQELNAQLSAYGQLKSAISAFESAMDGLGSLDKFKIFSSQSSDEDVLTAETTSAAAGGTYDVNITRLAQNHKMASDEVLDSATFGGGAGDELTVTVGSDAMTVDLSTAMTLSDLRDAINSASDNPGITASILNTDADNNLQRLILTSDEQGYDERLQLSFSGGVSSGTFNFATINQEEGATMTDLTHLDSTFEIDGFALTASSNSVSSVIDGITFDLHQIGNVTLDLDRDDEAINENVQSFVDAYNELSATISNLRLGELSGDPTLLSIERQLRSVINTTPSLTTAYTALSEIGIKTDSQTGELELNATELAEALQTDFNAVAQLFANNSEGYAYRFEALANTLQEEDGLVDGREETIESQIDDNEEDQLDFERRLELKELQLRSQFSALDTLIGQLNQTSQFLLQQQVSSASLG